jgi:cobalt/nickel transport system permease protein
MHMADALISPAVGATLWSACAGLIAWCSTKVRDRLDEGRIPLMGVLGAFVFAAQMINFTIPLTGSSGHLGGGLLLAILLGPNAAFLTIASILMVQALFFADGGLLALGCNIFNLGFFPTFIAYPLIYRKLAGRQQQKARLVIAAVVAAVIGLQLGAFAVVIETVASGISSLPFQPFLLLMQPIHLAIGIIEGLATAAVVAFVYRARPEIVESTLQQHPMGNLPIRSMLAGFATATMLFGGVVSWFASGYPDGLEWSIAQVTGHEELPEASHGVHRVLASLQEKLAVLPDYSLRSWDTGEATMVGGGAARIGTSISGLVGGLATLALCLVLGLLLRRRPRKG